LAVLFLSSGSWTVIEQGAIEESPDQGNFLTCHKLRLLALFLERSI
jgi:hypothetical protein